MTGKFCRLALVALVAAIAITNAAGAASSYPDKPIKMIVTFAAGGSSDVLARVVANSMSKGLGKQIVIENRPGAGGQIGAEVVAHAEPDGYTLLFGTNGTLAIGPALYEHLRYDPLKDLAPVGLLQKLPLVLIANPSVPVKNLKELITYAHANPGKLTYAPAGVGSVSHLSAELLKSAANIDILHVPYRGGGAAIHDLISGQVSMMLETIPNALPLIRSGQMRALGVTTHSRSAAAPDLPTLEEQGLAGFDVGGWTGLFAPAGTPPAIIARLNAETVKITSDPDYLAHLKKMGTDVVSSTPEELAAFMRKDISNWTSAVKKAGVKKIE